MIPCGTSAQIWVKNRQNSCLESSICDFRANVHFWLKFTLSLNKTSIFRIVWKSFFAKGAPSDKLGYPSYKSDRFLLDLKQLFFGSLKSLLARCCCSKEHIQELYKNEPHAPGDFIASIASQLKVMMFCRVLEPEIHHFGRYEGSKIAKNCRFSSRCGGLKIMIFLSKWSFCDVFDPYITANGVRSRPVHGEKIPCGLGIAQLKFHEIWISPQYFMPLGWGSHSKIDEKT